MSNPPWLSPVEALTRFQPPQSIHFSQDENSDEFKVRYGYRVGQHGFLVKPETYSEVVDDHAIYNLPLTDSFVRGMVNLRGNLVPVFDLSPLLTENLGSTGTHTVLVVGEAGNEIGVLIDDIPKAIYDTGNKGNLPPLPRSFQNYVQEGITQGGIDWVEFDCQAYFKAYAERALEMI